MSTKAQKMKKERKPTKSVHWRPSGLPLLSRWCPRISDGALKTPSAKRAEKRKKERKNNSCWRSRDPATSNKKLAVVPLNSPRLKKSPATGPLLSRSHRKSLCRRVERRRNACAQIVRTERHAIDCENANWRKNRKLGVKTKKCAERFVANE